MNLVLCKDASAGRLIKGNVVVTHELSLLLAQLLDPCYILEVLLIHIFNFCGQFIIVEIVHHTLVFITRSYFFDGRVTFRLGI